MPTSLRLDSALATDLYQLTLMAGYFVADTRRRASFEMFVRRLPQGRSFLIAAGIEQNGRTPRLATTD